MLLLCPRGLSTNPDAPIVGYEICYQDPSPAATASGICAALRYAQPAILLVPCAVDAPYLAFEAANSRLLSATVLLYELSETPHGVHPSNRHAGTNIVHTPLATLRTSRIFLPSSAVVHPTCVCSSFVLCPAPLAIWHSVQTSRPTKTCEGQAYSCYPSLSLAGTPVFCHATQTPHLIEGFWRQGFSSCHSPPRPVRSAIWHTSPTSHQTKACERQEFSSCPSLLLPGTLAFWYATQTSRLIEGCCRQGFFSYPSSTRPAHSAF
mmetsp:Transcript_29649/g.57324  ORF Transcript_29649/g.57324 Transcript_29649/m.57324 type:complete len:264 (+) Transcript_29649:830-1621(+)